MRTPGQTGERWNNYIAPNWGGSNLLKHATPPRVLPYRSWSFQVKPRGQGVTKMTALQLWPGVPPIWDGGVADTLKHVRPIVFPRRNLSFCVKRSEKGEPV